MVEPAAQSEQSESMEEILQSIKRIMDDNTVSDKKPSEDSDVFDLTNVVKDDDSATESSVPSEDLANINSEYTVKSVDSVFSSGDDFVSGLKTYAGDIGEGLMSKQSVNAAATEFQKIVDSTQKDYSIPNIPSPHLRSGNTVEDLIIESLRPMLKEWLDTNLPVIVQRIVEKEVKRIVTLHND